MTGTPRITKGRGATSNRSGRFEAWAREAVEDDWPTPEAERESPATTLVRDTSRSVITYNQSPDVPFDRSINPYRGCEHGCVYCFARPTHAYLDLSPGLDFETQILYKPDSAQLLESELANPKYECGTIALGANTDPYQPVERRLRITRGILEVLQRQDHPVSIITKSALVERDLDILSAMAERNLVEVRISVTTLDGVLARRMEPRAAAPHRRLEASRRLSEAGVPVGLLCAPIIPYLNDSEMEAILQAAREAGCRSAGYILLRLPLEIKDLFQEWLDLHYPLKAKRILNRVRDTRGGRLYDSEFGKRMRGTGEYAELIAKRFQVACRRMGFGESTPLDTSRFMKPAPRTGQLSLF